MNAGNPGGTLVATSSLWPTGQTGQAPNNTVTNQYSTQNFVFPSINLTAGQYYVVLWSTTGTPGSQQYFFKNNSSNTLYVANDPYNSVVPNGSNDPPLPVEAVPELTTVMTGLTSAAIAGMAAYRGRIRKKPVVG